MKGDVLTRGNKESEDVHSSLTSMEPQNHHLPSLEPHISLYEKFLQIKYPRFI